MYLGTLYMIIILIRKTLFLQIRYPVENSTSQGKTISENYSDLAIDGNINSCAISVSKAEGDPWWSVKFDRDYNVERVIIRYNLMSENSKYMNHFNIFVSKDPANLEEFKCNSYKDKKKEVNRFLILNCKKPITGNLVTIKRFGGVFKTWLVLCEVLIYADITLISTNKPTTANSVFFTNASGLAVDGNNDTCANIIAKSGEFAWWRVILDDDYFIDKVVIYFKPTSKEVFTFDYFNVFVSSECNEFEKDICFNFHILSKREKLNGLIDLSCIKPIIGKYLTIKKFGGDHPYKLQGLCEVDVHTKEFVKLHQLSKPDCPSNEATCLSLNSCIPENKLCDNINHCPNGVDELFCKCQPHQYKCQNYYCITREWLCDGHIDCPQGDDEKSGCDCPEGQFKCIQRQICLNNEKQCDGFNDCPDNSDEDNCFYFKDSNLLATFKGISDYNVCSTNWDVTHSRQICHYLSNSVEFGSSSEMGETENMKFVILKNLEPFENNIPSIAFFNASDSCPSKKIISIDCLEGKGVGSICGTRGYPEFLYGPYIINGKMAKDGAWPWHAQLIKNGVYFCGGSIIRNNWILTSAQCILGTTPSSLTVKVGSIWRNDPKISSLRISHIVRHPLFIRADYTSDIALLRLEKDIEFSNDVRPICLPGYIPDSEIVKSFRYCVLTGFGYIDGDCTSPPMLMQGRMNIMTDDECADNLSDITFNSKSFYEGIIQRRYFLCAGSAPTDFGIRSCSGDIGSPLVCKNKKGVWTQVALVSFGTR